MRSLAPIILSLFCVTGASLARDSTTVLNNIEVVVRGTPSPPVQDEKKYCPQCLDIMKRYREADTTDLLEEYREPLSTATRIIDSLNDLFPVEHHVKRLVLWRGVGRMYHSQLVNDEIHIAAAYLFLYPSPVPLRSVIFHEMGHALFDALAEREQENFRVLWNDALENGIIDLFKEGTYPKNLFLLGHPEDDPSELFASALAIVNIYQREFNKRIEERTPPESCRTLVLEISGYATHYIGAKK